MSASKRAYEGPDPTQLLLEVWSNHGTDARITEPERVRKGGVFGFFATSVYRVEVDDSVPNDAGASTWPATAAEVKRPDSPLSPAPRTTAPNLPLGTPPPVASMRPSQQIDDRIGVTAGLASLLEEAEDSFELSALPTRTFDEVLEEVAGSLGADPATFTPPPFSAPAPAPRVEPLELERFDSIDDLVRRAIRNTVAEDEALGIAVPDRTVDLLATPSQGTIVADATATTDNVPTAPIHAAEATEADDLTHTPVDLGSASLGVPTPVVHLPISVPETRHAPGARARLLAVLEAAGYPLSLLEPLEASSLFPTSAEDAFAILGHPPALPRVLGALTAVVAPVDEALPLARALATSYRLDPTTVALVTGRTRPSTHRPATQLGSTPVAGRPGDGLVATDLAGIRALAPGWRRDRVGIVAVELDHRDLASTRAALREMTPSAVWLAADARSKCEDVAATVERIGGADALMAVHATQTTTPAALLRNGIPVATIDGRRADARRWARLVRCVAGEE